MRIVLFYIALAVVMTLLGAFVGHSFEKAMPRPRIMELSCEERPDGSYNFRYTINGTYAEVVIRDKGQVEEFREYLGRVGDW